MIIEVLDGLVAKGDVGNAAIEATVKQPGDQHQDIGEHLPWRRDLGHLERELAAVADDLGADLDELLAQAGQRPRLCRRGYRQRPHEVAKIAGQRMKLKADCVGRRRCGMTAGYGRLIDIASIRPYSDCCRKDK
jgi:hypothetical protein